jgi:hypothetical protein
MGRPSKLTDELTDQLCNVFTRGQTSIESACALVGISKRTYHAWMERGRNGDPDYEHFLHSIEKSRAQAVQSYLDVIHNAAMNGTWQAAAWWLERVLPEQYGRKTTVETITRDLLLEEVAKLEAEMSDAEAG